MEHLYLGLSVGMSVCHTVSQSVHRSVYIFENLQKTFKNRFCDCGRSTILQEQSPRAKQSNLPDNNLLTNRDFQLSKTYFSTKVTINRSQVTMHEWM